VLARALIAPLTPIEWSEQDDLAAQPPLGTTGDDGPALRH
jgi:ATP-dependent Lon protease